MSHAAHGERAVARCDELGRAPFSESTEHLSRPYLTPSHRRSLDRIAQWMAAAGLATRVDPLGNLIGRLEGTQPRAPALLIGSHIDSVRNGGRYDGALGVMIGIECVEALRRRGRTPPFAIEIIAFGDEEGSRFPASMLCSRGITRPIADEALDLADADGRTLAEALAAFGLDPGATAQAARRRSDILAYVEAHIEQGPVLEAQDLPVGVVTGIAAQLRLKACFLGEAGHAGTSPMGLRRDAMAAAAAAVLAVEAVCAAGGEDLRGTVGRLVASTGAYNVIVGKAEIGIDVRAATRPARDAAAEEIHRRLSAIAAERGLALEFEVVQDLADCPCDLRLSGGLMEAVKSAGVRPFKLLSGAGHDAMAVSALCPVAMLFIRCERGVSHNPAEAVAATDVAVAVQVLEQFVDNLRPSLSE